MLLISTSESNAPVGPTCIGGSTESFWIDSNGRYEIKSSSLLRRQPVPGPPSFHEYKTSRHAKLLGDIFLLDWLFPICGLGDLDRADALALRHHSGVNG